MLIPKIVKLICLVPVTAYAQPPEQLPPTPPNYINPDLDGVGGVTANDFQVFMNSAAYAQGVAAQRPLNVSGLAGAVSCQDVTRTGPKPPAGFGG